MLLRPVVRGLLLAVFLVGNVSAEVDFKEVMNDPGLSYEEKKAAYFDFIARKNPQMAETLKMPGMQAIYENTFRQMYDSTKVMADIEAQQGKSNSNEEDAELAKQKAYMKYAAEQQAKVQAAKPQLSGNQKILAGWPSSGITPEVRSGYEVKGIAPGDLLIKQASALMDEGYLYGSKKPGESIQFGRIKPLKGDIILSENFSINGFAQAPDIVSYAAYSIETKIKGSRAGKGAVPIESISLPALKEKLVSKYGAPLDYDKVMAASIEAAENHHKTSRQWAIDSAEERKQAECSKMKSVPNANPKHFEYCEERINQQRDKQLARLGEFDPAAVQYAPCLDENVEVREYGGCISKLAPMPVRPEAKLARDSQGSALFGEKCYVWIDNAESITLCKAHPKLTRYVITVRSKKVADWLATAAKDNVSDESLSVDIDL